MWPIQAGRETRLPVSIPAREPIQKEKKTITLDWLAIITALVICNSIIYLQITFLMEATVGKDNN